MLQLKKITKTYNPGSVGSQEALKGISINFRESEFVAILGPSGCGKTTTLNIIGGLDHYTSGDLIINGTSTKDFTDRDWDNYRNKTIGFVFQNYNLIPHLNLQANVAMGLTLAGIKKSKRMEMAKEALEKVGLGDQLKKMPNQISGGQGQRVAIARALVSNPDIILADEPTGALDSESGIVVMELLKSIAKEKLVIMVTHNEELAKKYATRIITMFDGNLIEDTNALLGEDLVDNNSQRDENLPTAPAQKAVKQSKKKSGMSQPTAFGFSLKTLGTKKGRTAITSIAGSIGIFSIALILSLSAGMTNYVTNVESSALGTSAIVLSESATVYNFSTNTSNQLEAYPSNSNGITPYTGSNMISVIENNFSDEFLEYISNIDKSLTRTIEYTYSTSMNIISSTSSGYKLINSTSGSGWQDVSSQTLSNEEMVLESYEVLYKTNSNGLPSQATELTLVVDKYNRLSTTTLDALGIDYSTGLDEISYETLCQKEFKLIKNDDFYTFENNIFSTPSTSSQLETLYQSGDAVTLKIVGVIRIKDDDSSQWLSTGIVYSSQLSDLVREDAASSQIGLAQIASTTTNVLTGETFVATASQTAEEQYQQALQDLGLQSSPTSISLYPSSIDNKTLITEYIDAWNEANPDNEIVYTDYSETILNMISSMINIISYVLIAFCAVSLIVSTIMIGVTTYTSVIERTKEIGVLRSLGARKKDISRIFNAETIMIGAFAGLIGVALAWVIGFGVSAIIENLFAVSGIASLSLPVALIMVLLSIVLTWIAGLVPSKIAANKDSVECLRTE